LRGDTPSLKDWYLRPEYPNPQTVARHCGSWSAAIRAAGFEPRQRGESI
jgi:hypothetical protein